jgi:hypothetical protein
VIRAYLEQAEQRRAHAVDQGVFVSRVEVRGPTGPQAHFASGERATVEVEVVSRGRFERLAIVVGLKDAKDYLIFHASSESVLGRTVSLGPDEAISCTFELQLHLAPGRYRVATWVHRYDISKQLDHWASAATIFVSQATEVGGVVNLYPSVRLGAPRPAPAVATPPTAAAPVAANPTAER